MNTLVLITLWVSIISLILVINLSIKIKCERMKTIMKIDKLEIENFSLLRTNLNLSDRVTTLKYSNIYKQAKINILENNINKK